MPGGLVTFVLATFTVGAIGFAACAKDARPGTSTTTPPQAVATPTTTATADVTAAATSSTPFKGEIAGVRIDEEWRPTQSALEACPPAGFETVSPPRELAPRDVVARANYRQLAQGHQPYLDTRAAVGRSFPQRFPTVFALAAQHGLDPRVDLLPVTPAAHYCMGGVAVDHDGRTSLAGLWAAGEVSASGLHGGNRLASNSLLEGLVMARRVASDVAAHCQAAGPIPVGRMWLPTDLADITDTGAQTADVIEQLRQILWTGAGVERDADGLAAALARLHDLARPAHSGVAARAVHTVARLVLLAAQARTESRGAHFRADYQAGDPTQASRRFWTFDPVPADVWLPIEAPAEPVGLISVPARPPVTSTTSTTVDPWAAAS